MVKSGIMVYIYFYNEALKYIYGGVVHFLEILLCQLY